MPKFYMMVGLPGSGKSTYAKTIPDTEVFSSDALRKELYGSEAVQEHNEKVFTILMKRMLTALKEGKNVVMDAMNISRRYRMHILRCVSKYSDYKEAVLVATPYEECLKRNSKRERVVPEEVIKSAYMRFTVPCEQEGFDRVEIIYSEGFDNIRYSTIKLQECIMPHDNKHHTLSINEHMRKAYEYISEKTKDYLILTATRLHDIGKPFTKRFGPDGEAHYYGHQNVGAYISLFYEYPSEKIIIERALLIEHHMDFYTRKDSMYKVKEFLGDELFEKLEKLHEADMEAH